MTRFGNHRGRTALASAVALAAGLGLPALGQAQELSEVVVTARRVEEKLKEVPVSVTAFDSATIAAAGITNLQDVANLTPGLSFFNAFGENLPVPVVRGIVPQDIFGENATAIFVDGVYVSGREGLNFSQLDAERIEVLKGPQSAQYGRNAFAGAINYVTKAPSDVFEARTEFEGGNRGKQRVFGMVSGPLVGEALTGRLTALYDEWDGSYDNSLAPENDIGGYRYRSLQGKLRWRPMDNLDINLGLYSSNDEIDDPATAGVPANCEDQVEQTTANAEGGPFPRLQNYCGRVPKLAATPDALDRNSFPDLVPVPNSVTGSSMPKIPEATGEDRDLLRANLNIVWDLDFGTFSFLTGYSDTEQNSRSDFGRSSGNTLPFIYCPDAVIPGVVQCQPPYSWVRVPMGFVNLENGDTTEELSQEIRFTSPRDRSLRYSTGLYYFSKEQKSYPGAPVATTQLPVSIFDNIGIGPVAYPTTLAIGSYIFGGSLLPDGAIDPLVRPELQDKTDGWSVFGAVEYDLTEAWQVSLEARLSNDHLDYANYEYTRCHGSDPDTGDPIGDSQFPFNNPDVANCGDDYFDLRVTAPEVTDRGSARFQYGTGRATLKYTFESGWMTYASIAHGEKPGGLQLVRADVLTGTGQESELVRNPFDPEKINTYELGLKGYTENRRVGVDFAVFYNDWTDIVLRQLLENSPASGRPLTQVTGFNVNAGDAEVWGFELTADATLTDNLTGRLTVGYTDSTITNARQDTYSLFPTFYTTEPSCAPAAIQAIQGADADATEALQEAKAVQCRQISGDVSGNTQLRQPPWTASASLTYRRQLAGDWDWYTRADGNYLGKIYVGNDNQSYLPSRTNVNLRIGAESGRYSLEFWVRNLFENNDPIAAFRDIYWTNTDDFKGQESPPTIREASNFDDFPPFRLSVTYPSLRTFGLLAKVKFGGEVK
jgi:iron complex outermembrane receptor protein